MVICDCESLWYSLFGIVRSVLQMRRGSDLDVDGW